MANLNQFEAYIYTNRIDNQNKKLIPETQSQVKEVLIKVDHENKSISFLDEKTGECCLKIEYSQIQQAATCKNPKTSGMHVIFKESENNFMSCIVLCKDKEQFADLKYDVFDNCVYDNKDNKKDGNLFKCNYDSHEDCLIPFKTMVGREKTRVFTVRTSSLDIKTELMVDDQGLFFKNIYTPHYSGEATIPNDGIAFCNKNSSQNVSLCCAIQEMNATIAIQITFETQKECEEFQNVISNKRSQSLLCGTNCNNGSKRIIINVGGNITTKYLQ